MKAKDIGIKVLTEVCRVLLGGTFVFSGFVKAVDPFGTAYKIEDYMVAFGAEAFHMFALPLSILLCTIEFTVGVFMLLGMYRKWNSRMILLIMLFMTPLTLYLAIANPVSDCGCFGDAFKITNWETFYKNVVLLVAAVITVIYNQKIFNLFTGKFYWLAGIFIVSFGIAFSVYNYLNEPLLDFRPYKIGANLPQLISVEEGKGDVYENVFVYEKNGVKQEFTEDNYPWQDSTWVYVDRLSKLIKEGEKPQITDFQITRLYFNPEKTDFEGEEDITQEVLEDNGYVFLMVARSLKDMDESFLSRFADVNNYSIDHHYKFYCLTASTKEDILAWENETSNNFIYCLTDEKTLKTMMRSNPGLMLIKNGVVINKLTASKVPSEQHLIAPVEDMPIGQMTNIKEENNKKLRLVVFIFLCPLILIKSLDFLIYNRKKKKNEEESNFNI